MKRQGLAGGFIAPALLKIRFKARRAAKPNGLYVMLHVLSISRKGCRERLYCTPLRPLRHDG
jgi:hypothetical protein